VRILITGASGMLGATLAEMWKDRFDVFSTAKEDYAENTVKNFMPFDLLNKSYDTLMNWARPNVIIHCAAITNVDYCENHPEQALAVNAESVKLFLKSDPEAKLIFISSDAVFPDGLHLATVNDKTSPENVYGKSKEAGEIAIQNSGEQHLVVRTTIVGKNINSVAKGFVEWIISSVNDGNVITLFDDTLFTPITIWHLADELEWIINNEISGVVHVVGSESISKYQFGIRICELLGLDTNLIQKGSINDVNFQAKRSKDQTMDSEHYQRYHRRSLPSIDETVDIIVQHFKEFTYE